MTGNIEASMLEDIIRAVEMLRIAATYIRAHDPEGTAFYDEAECDGYCIADDCESIAEALEAINA